MPIFFFCLLAFLFNCVQAQQEKFTYVQGAIVRGDSTKPELSLVFTADEFGKGLSPILKTLKKEGVKGSFFFTGRFYRNKAFQQEIRALANEGHYLGPHSDQHLLYCDWTKRDSLLVTRDSFERDMTQNLAAMKANGVLISTPHFFIPPYEWWNDSIAAWSKAQGLQLFNFTPGMRTNADYTFPEMGTSYKSSEWIINWLKDIIATNPEKLNGAIVLIHAGTDPRRKDKLYNRLLEIILLLRKHNFQLKRIDDLLK
jgi:peptidoglycan/xylan/chitin deacetylase (PgdA/CDA1 family)